MKLRVQGLLMAGSALRGVGPRGQRAFTIIELLAATAILGIILAVIFGITQQISNAWKNSSAKIEAFQGARGAFSAMTQQIGQATLNTYYDYYDAGGNRRVAGDANFKPAKYGRYSDLHFVSGGWSGSGSLAPNQVTHAIFFQAPMGYATAVNSTLDYSGMDTLLNACGYYIVYNTDNTRPQFLDDSTIPNSPPNRYRFRLMQFLQPSQQLAIYPYVSGAEKNWFTTPLDSPTPPVRIVAENIIALILLPKSSTIEDQGADSLAPKFEYDTRSPAGVPDQKHQLPPVVEIIMVAIDEPSAQKICTGSAMPDFGISGGLSGLFKNASDLNDAGGTPGDLAKLTKALEGRHVGYRVFRSQIALRGSKWSKE